DHNYRAIHLPETAGRFLLPSGGPMTTDITDLVRQELRFELRSALHRAFERGEATLSTAISVGFNGSARRTYLQVKPVVNEHDKKPSRAMVLFIEGDAAHLGSVAAGDPGQPSNQAVQRLEQELEFAQGQLRTTREESEAANEELRAANEELQSINE